MLTIKDLSARQDLDRAAMGAVAGGTGIPGLALTNNAHDLFDVLGSAVQLDHTAIANVDNNGALVANVVSNDKYIYV